MEDKMKTIDDNGWIEFEHDTSGYEIIEILNRVLSSHKLKFVLDTTPGKYDAFHYDLKDVEPDEKEKCDRCGKADDNTETYYEAYDPDELICSYCVESSFETPTAKWGK
jgi:hypothetical protein